MACSASTFLRVRPWLITPRNTWTGSPPSSTGVHVKPLAGSRLPRHWLSSWKRRHQQVLRPPHETTRQTRGIRYPPALRSQVPRHLREVVDVTLHVLDRVLDRQRPVLLRAGRHQHAPVALVQPAQVGVRLVDLEVVAVVAHALG